MEKLVVSSFTGGLTDNYLNPSSPSQYQKCDNLLLIQDGSLISRPGCTLVLGQHSFIATPSGVMMDYQDEKYMVLQSAENLLYAKTSALTDWSVLWFPDTTPGSYTQTFTHGGPQEISFAEWKNHLLVVAGYRHLPAKIYVDASEVVHGVTAGLPELSTPINYNASTALTAACAMANALVADLGSHFYAAFVDTGNPGHRGIGDTLAHGFLSATPATNLASLLVVTRQLQQAYLSHYKDYESLGVYHFPETDMTAVAFTVTQAMQAPTITAEATTLEEAALVIMDVLAGYTAHSYDADIHGTNAPTNLPNHHAASDLADLNITSGPTTSFDLGGLYNTANGLKLWFNNHVNSAVAHPGGVDSGSLVTAADATTRATLQTLVGQLVFGFTRHMADATAGSPTYHQATGTSYLINGVRTPRTPATVGGPAFDDKFVGVTPYAIAHSIDLLNAMRTAFNLHVKDMAAHYTVNPSTTTLADTKAPGAALSLADYVYAFVISNTYTASAGVVIVGGIGTVEYLDESTPIYLQASSVLPTTYTPLNVNSIPTITNTPATGYPFIAYDLVNLKIKIFRTVSGGNQYFKVGEVANGVSTFSDTISDTDLVQMEQLYTQGGVVDNDSPPASKFVAVRDNKAYYANFHDGADYYPNRIRESIANDIDSCPRDSFVDLPYEILGMSVCRGFLMAWTQKATYRIEGGFDEKGNGSMQAISISDSIGIACKNSPVAIDGGLLFWAHDGIYFTDGYRLQKINIDWLESYKALIAAPTYVRGTLDKTNQRVWWSTAFSKAVVLDLRHGLKENACFTTATFANTLGVQGLLYSQGDIFRVNDNGDLYRHSTSTYDDAGQLLVWDFISCAYLGEVPARKWTPKLLLQFKNLGNLTTDLYSINDDNPSNKKALSKIRYRGGGTKSIEEKRHFPPKSLRCDQKQIQITNAVSGVAGERMQLLNYAMYWAALGDEYQDAKGEGNE